LATGAPSGLRSEAVRQSNLTALLRTLHLDGSASRSELVAHTGLTRSAVGALVGELRELDYVDEERASSDGSPGRPSPVVTLQSERHVVIAVEILVDSVAVAIVGLGGRIIRAIRVDRERARVTAERTVDDVVDLVRQLVGRLEDTEYVYGIGVTVAGVVRRADNTVMIAPNLGWHRVPLGAMLSDGCGLDVPVSIGNDGDLGALAESRRGAAAGHRDVVYVSAEVGVGGGIISSGRPITGAAGFAGEIGHITVNPDGLPCRCGGTGCWETEVGEKALLRRTGRRPDGGRSEVAAVLAAAEAGDRSVLDALDVHGRWLGIGLASIVNVLDPTIVVLGGFLGEVYGFVSDRVQHELTHRMMSDVRSSIEIVPSALDIDGPLLGAAELAWDPVLADPAGAASQRLSLVVQ